MSPENENPVEMAAKRFELAMEHTKALLDKSQVLSDESGFDPEKIKDYLSRLTPELDKLIDRYPHEFLILLTNWRMMSSVPERKISPEHRKTLDDLWESDVETEEEAYTYFLEMIDKQELANVRADYLARSNFRGEECYFETLKDFRIAVMSLFKSYGFSPPDAFRFGLNQEDLKNAEALKARLPEGADPDQIRENISDITETFQNPETLMRALLNLESGEFPEELK